MQNTRRCLTSLVVACVLAVAQTFLAASAIVTINIAPISAQMSEMPSIPNGDATTADIQPPQSPVSDPPPPTKIPLPTVKITSHYEGQEVPVGELTIEGISSDDIQKDCCVYADVNDMTPMRDVSGIDFGDVSKWNFKYTREYQLITEGSNELTAKISCFAPGNPTPLSEWHSMNVTGVIEFQPPETETGEEEVEEVEEVEDEDD